MWCRTRTDVLVNLEQCRIIQIEEDAKDGQRLRIMAYIDSTTPIELDGYDVGEMSRTEAAHEAEIVRDEIFRAISNGARFYRVEKDRV